MNLSSEVLDKLRIYRENFEKAYLEATEEFYKTQAAVYLQENGVQNYMKYVSKRFPTVQYFHYTVMEIL